MAIFDRQSLVRQLQRCWAFGERFALAWTVSPGAIQVLFLPRDRVLAIRRAHPSSWTGPLETTPAAWAELRRAASASGQVARYVCAGRLGPDQCSVLEALVGRYAVSLSPPRPVLLFDLVGFTLLGPIAQLQHLAALERALSEAEHRLVRWQAPLDLRRTTTGDGFYVWDDGPDGAVDGRLFALLLITMLRFRHLAQAAGFDPDGLKACAGIGRYWQLHRIEHGEPQADGFIVGEVTIELARLMGDCRPGHVLLAIGHQGRCLDRLAGAVIDANRLLRDHAADLGSRVEARLAVGKEGAGASQPAVRTIRAKHGWVYRAVDLVWAAIGAPPPRPASA